MARIVYSEAIVGGTGGSISCQVYTKPAATTSRGTGTEAQAVLKMTGDPPQRTVIDITMTDQQRADLITALQNVPTS